MFYIYLILCKNGSIYTGITGDSSRRFFEHKTKQGSKHTRDYGVIQLVYTEEYSTKKEALEREKQIKKWRREKKLNLIKYGHPNGPQEQT